MGSWYARAKAFKQALGTFKAWVDMIRVMSPAELVGMIRKDIDSLPGWAGGCDPISLWLSYRLWWGLVEAEGWRVVYSDRTIMVLDKRNNIVAKLEAPLQLTTAYHIIMSDLIFPRIEQE